MQMALPNIIDIESDNDLCYDVKEAGFADADIDGRLGFFAGNCKR